RRRGVRLARPLAPRRLPPRLPPHRLPRRPAPERLAELLRLRVHLVLLPPLVRRLLPRGPRPPPPPPPPPPPRPAPRRLPERRAESPAASRHCPVFAHSRRSAAGFQSRRRRTGAAPIRFRSFRSLRRR